MPFSRLDSTMADQRVSGNNSPRLLVVHCAVLLAVLGLVIAKSGTPALISDTVQAEFCAIVEACAAGDTSPEAEVTVSAPCTSRRITSPDAELILASPAIERRQGPGARTHLMSPAMVASAAVSGHLADVRPLLAGRKL